MAIKVAKVYESRAISTQSRQCPYQEREILWRSDSGLHLLSIEPKEYPSPPRGDEGVGT
jgi:hypothetical protein